MGIIALALGVVALALRIVALALGVIALALGVVALALVGIVLVAAAGIAVLLLSVTVGVLLILRIAVGRLPVAGLALRIVSLVDGRGLRAGRRLVWRQAEELHKAAAEIAQAIAQRLVVVRVGGCLLGVGDREHPKETQAPKRIQRHVFEAWQLPAQENSRLTGLNGLSDETK